jgi:hypothetical protein
MQNNPESKKVEQGPDTQQSVVAVLVKQARNRFRSSPGRVFIIATVVFLLSLPVAYFLWPRQKSSKVAVEIPPTLEARHEGEEHDDHSQEGAVEVPDETAELIGLND